MSGKEFSPEQKQYLQGFVSGIDAGRAAKGLPGLLNGMGDGASGGAVEPTGPDAEQLKAQNRFLAAGKNLVKEETAKRDAHPFDIYDQLRAKAAAGVFPDGVDIFRWKFHGLFYVAPAQDSFMCRLRIPNGILTSRQFRGVAALAEKYGGAYSHVTTRANLQIREIAAENGIHVIEGLQDLGLTAKRSGADNIRNITGSPTAGIDAQELYDTRDLAKALHNSILNKRALYGLPRKFNIAFDGGGRIAVLEDTNDIGFQAVRVNAGCAVAPGVWFRLLLGGITGHEDFARDTGVIVKPEDCVEVAEAILKLFIANGDRTNRNKARMKYVLDELGIEKYIAETESILGWEFVRVSPDQLEPRPAPVPHAHIGVHAQRQKGLSYIGVVLPVGRIDVAQMNGLAEISERFGSGTVRLTVWQNLIISDIPDAKLDDVKARIVGLGLDWQATNIRGGLIACTGNTGCRFSASDTKRHATEIADYVASRVALDLPVNIHLTGCHHSCSQHYIGDIGLLACKIDVDEDGEEQVEGYHIYVGGGFAGNAKIGREIYRDVPAEEAPLIVEILLSTYLKYRMKDTETFQAFTQRYEADALRQLVAEVKS